ncbi:hypothetical protein [Microbacterium dextranolyticum]|uniref:Uncharacterized protein n=1 Tax=Microbacterium dextranolyticum TaxID=36806 RepID=A0A9W6HLT6_9MICO|nr:hypothetical protein [Microbacterium dextranolyticum]MBM7463249.1 hypothetical protein [Microbacterium dextranolyticum]GLJ95645.1 hypothetical protein GCM10017591_17080 [Microbacterium dextranolyticum]
MGIFQSRPEDPTEWAGLPAEPWEPRAPAETLPEGVTAPSALGLSEPGTQITLNVFAVATDASGAGTVPSSGEQASDARTADDEDAS